MIFHPFLPRFSFAWVESTHRAATSCAVRGAFSSRSGNPISRGGVCPVQEGGFRMSLGDEIRGHLPFLRRYARALTGSQQHVDNFVHTLLEVVVAAPDEFASAHGTRIDLYRAFPRLWERAAIDNRKGSRWGKGGVG